MSNLLIEVSSFGMFTTALALLRPGWHEKEGQFVNKQNEWTTPFELLQRNHRLGPLDCRGKSERFLSNFNLRVFLHLLNSLNRITTLVYSVSNLFKVCQSRQISDFFTHHSMNVYSKANAQLHLCSTEANKASHSESLWCGKFFVNHRNSSEFMYKWKFTAFEINLSRFSFGRILFGVKFATLSHRCLSFYASAFRKPFPDSIFLHESDVKS